MQNLVFSFYLLGILTFISQNKIAKLFLFLIQIKISNARFKITAAKTPAAPLAGLLNCARNKVAAEVRSDMQEMEHAKSLVKELEEKTFHQNLPVPRTWF